MAKKTSRKGAKPIKRLLTGPSGQAASRAGGSSTSSRGTAGKRELVNTGTDKRYVRRGAGGQFKESDDVGRLLQSDRQAKRAAYAKAGYGDRYDRKSSKPLN